MLYQSYLYNTSSRYIFAGSGVCGLVNALVFKILKSIYFKKDK